MAQDSWPSPNHNTRNVTDPEYERIASRFSDDGINGDPTDTAVVSAGVGLEVVVRAGVYGSVRGHAWTSGTTDVALTIAANASGSTRYDWVVLRLDRSTWDVRAAIVQGTPGAGSPTMTQDDAGTGVWEIPLALVTVPNAASSVTVARKEQYIGGRVRPSFSSNYLAFPRMGDMQFEQDTGRLRLWDGAARQTVWQDSGQVALGAPSANWEVVFTNAARRIGGLVWVRVWVRRTNSTLPSTTTGSVIGTVPEALRSPLNEPYTVKVANGPVARIEIQNSGDIVLLDPAADITVGKIVAATMTYMLP